MHQQMSIFALQPNCGHVFSFPKDLHRKTCKLCIKRVYFGYKNILQQNILQGKLFQGRATMQTDTQTLSESVEAIWTFSKTIMKMAHQELIQHLEEAGIDLQPHQFMILHRLKGRTLTLVEMSREMGLDPSTLAPLIEACVRRGLLQRDRDPRDRRRAPLTLTPAGTELLSVEDRFDEQSLLAQSLTLMGEEKSQQFVNLLREFVTSLTTLAHQTTDHNGQCERSRGR
jgi:DNA-binding MarR family transcriptional regulator